MNTLHNRGKKLAYEFSIHARKPIVVEFAGVPKAGKTTTLANVQTFLKRCGFRTDVVIERASVCPIRDKKHANFNVWTACTTLSQILEKTQSTPHADDPQILFLDRGLFDSLCWLTMMEKISRLRTEDKEIVQKFLTLDDWRKRISAVFVMLVSASDAMKREQGVLPLNGAVGSIMNKDVLRNIREINKKCIDQFRGDFRIFEIDTSYGDTRNNPATTAETVANVILDLVEEQITERVLSCPKDVIGEIFGGNVFVDDVQAHKLTDTFQDAKVSQFLPRQDVEADASQVQAIPILVVRNANGHVLRLRRREKSVDNLLHNKIVLWAGGHVRVEDEIGGRSIVNCIVREVEEELRLQIEPSSIELIGAIYFDDGNNSARHVAIAYEWMAPSEDVSIVLSRSEFFEKRGTSLSGSFASIDKLAEDLQTRKLTEIWSVELVREYLAKDKVAFTPRLI